MAEYTPNYNLYKPNRNDTDIEVDTSLSENFTKIDTAIKSRATEISAVQSSLTSSVTSINNSITTLQAADSTNATAINNNVTATNTLKTAFELKHNTNGTFKGIIDTDISDTAAIKANKLAIQKLYKKTISPVVSATANTYGAAVVLDTFTGFSSLVPLKILGTALVPVGEEVITLSITATFNDSTTSEVVKTLDQNFSLTDNEFFTLFKDNLYITRLSFKVKSSIASSKIIVTINHTGFYL